MSGPESLAPDIMAFLLLSFPIPGDLIQPGDRAEPTRTVRIVLLGPRNLGRELTRPGFRHPWSQANSSGINLDKIEETLLGLSFPIYEVRPRTLSSPDCWEAQNVGLWAHVSKENLS